MAGYWGRLLVNVSQVQAEASGTNTTHQDKPTCWDKTGWAAHRRGSGVGVRGHTREGQGSRHHGSKAHTHSQTKTAINTELRNNTHDILHKASASGFTCDTILCVQNYRTLTLTFAPISAWWAQDSEAKTATFTSNYPFNSHLTQFHSIQLNLTPFNSIQNYSTPFNSIQLHSTPFNSISLKWREIEWN